MRIIAFTKVAYPYGWLGNMSAYPVTYRGKEYRTTEALFQCLRFPHSSRIQESIRSLKSPMGAKMRTKTFRKQLRVPICDTRDLERMALCLRLKCKYHPELRDALLKTGDAHIIEDCTARPRDIEIDGKNHANGGPFWGARWNADTRKWDGQNALGVLWMRLRKRFRLHAKGRFVTPASFIGHNFYPEIMSTNIAKATAAAKEQLERLEKLGQTEGKVLSLLKQAGFSDLASFVAALEEVSPQPAKRAVKKAPKAKKSTKGKAPVRKTDIKRPRVTAAKVAKMKALDKKGMSQNKIAKIVGTSVPTVGRYAKAGFKFEE